MNLSELSGISRVVCGPGSAKHLLEWIEGLGRVAVVTGRGMLQRGTAAAALFRRIPDPVHFTLAHEPSDLWVDAARSQLQANPVAAVISIGGGSVLDAGKALAVMLCEDAPTKDLLEGVGIRSPCGQMLPWFALPTTAGTGSEASTNAVLSRPGPGGFKKSLRHPAFRAAGVILDAELCQGASSQVTAACGMDALTQLLESWTSLRVTGNLEPLLEHGILLAIRALPVAVAGAPMAPLSARQDMLEAAFLSGVGLSRAGLGTVHGLAGPAGACSPVPHGLACARFFGPCLRETRRWLQEHPVEPACTKFRRLQDAGIDLDALETWADRFGLPYLRDHGLGEVELTAVLESASDRDSPARLGPAVWASILREAVGA